jgi:hypothetical protein
VGQVPVIEFIFMMAVANSHMYPFFMNVGAEQALQADTNEADIDEHGKQLEPFI